MYMCVCISTDILTCFLLQALVTLGRGDMKRSAEFVREALTTGLAVCVAKGVVKKAC